MDYVNLTAFRFADVPIGIPVGQYITMTLFNAYPKSRGSIHITGPELGDKLDFTTGYFLDPEGTDIKTQIWAYKRHREIFRRMDICRGEMASHHPQFAPDSKAACVRLDGSRSGDVQDIEYTAEDDKAIEDWVLGHVGTAWHSLGTCKMGPRDERGVVDANLSVYGVEALKIADLSIPPSNVAANTMNTAVAIGERAADIFITELGLDTK